YEFFLKLGIVLLGVRFLLGDVLKLGGISLIAVVLELGISIALMNWLGNAFKLTPKLTSLLAIGSSICGVSAIIAAKGAINAKDEDASFAIAAILALGAIGLFAFPLIGHALGLSDHAYGLWAGLAIDNTAEATAAGNLWSEQAGKIAVLAKTTRNATIGFVVLAYAIYWATRGEAQTIDNKAAFLWNKFPKFVLGFIVVSLAATLGVFSKEQAADLANLSRWAFLLTFARAWLAGFLAGLDAANAPQALPAAPPQKAEPLTILYATESGNSEKLAGDVAKNARKLGFKPALVDMADLDVASLKDVKRLIVIAATWGEGEPPARATRTYKELMSD